MIFVFIVMLFGLWTVFRTSDIFVRERFLARYQQIYLILMLVCVQFLVSRYIFDSYLAMWTLAWLPFLLSKLCFKVLIFTREKGFKDIFCQLLDEIIIEMR